MNILYKVIIKRKKVVTTTMKRISNGVHSHRLILNSITKFDILFQFVFLTIRLVAYRIRQFDIIHSNRMLIFFFDHFAHFRFNSLID